MMREFALTLSAAVLVSVLLSLTLSPALCALLLKPHREGEHPFLVGGGHAGPPLVDLDQAGFQ